MLEEKSERWRIERLKISDSLYRSATYCLSMEGKVFRLCYSNCLKRPISCLYDNQFLLNVSSNLVTCLSSNIKIILCQFLLLRLEKISHHETRVTARIFWKHFRNHEKCYVTFCKSFFHIFTHISFKSAVY